MKVLDFGNNPVNTEYTTILFQGKDSGNKTSFHTVIEQKNLEGISYKKHLFKLIFIHSVLPLLLGGLIYIFCRSKSLVMFRWFSYLGLDNLIESLRADLIGFKELLPQWLYYSMPDGLWVYSMTSALVIYWRKSPKYGRYWLIVPFTLGVGVEILQGFNLFLGTFDWIDLIVSFLGFSMSIIVINLKLKQYEK
ncbi:hypothetical protein ACPDHL_11990 [Myroides sp. C15-4]|uniref:hypothetical protein n=1 Tax=Myroides sp. C15-4 TaxID=3400532 RepID=UPI003D2F8BB7